jgi:Tfp pilus assembly protein PilV
MRTTHSNGFTLLEVMISGALLAMLMLAVMGLLSQAQQDMQKTAVQTEMTEKTRRTMWRLAQELAESSFDTVVAGYRNLPNGGTGVVRNYVQSTTEPNMVQCTDPNCPWLYNAQTTAEITPNVNLARRVELNDNAGAFSTTAPESHIVAAGTSTTGRMWVGRSVGPCPAGHTVAANATATVDLGTDWQSLVFYAPFSLGGNVTELRRYAFFVDDLVEGADALAVWTDATGQGVVAPPAGETHAHTGAGVGGSAFATNTPAGKPTLLGLLDYDGDGATADGIFDTATADATVETLDIVAVGTNSLITYVKRGNAGGGNYNFALTIDRRTGEINCAVNHTFSSGDTYVRTVQVTGRQPETIASRVTDIEFATIRNCPYDAIENPTGLLAGQDSTVVRITAMFDKLLGRNQDAVAAGGLVERALTSQELVVTRVQPRN